jgi:DNA-binding transcriptional MocR family regulator
LEAPPYRVLLAHGAQHALLAALVALTRPGDTVICERLTYTGIRRLAELIQVRMTAADIDSEGLVPDALERTLRDSGAKVVICTPVTQNPTVACMPASRRRKIASICSKFDAFLIEDDIYAPLAGDREPPIASFAPDRTVHITSFSKCVAPGFRLGYAAVPERLVNVMSDALVAAQWTAPSLYGELAALMIESGAANDCVSAQQAEARRRLGIAHEHLGDSFREEHLTFHLWIDVPSERRPDDLVNELFQRGVRVSPASHFAIDDSALPNAIRVSLGSCTEDAALRDGLATIGRTLRQRPQFSGTII